MKLTSAGVNRTPDRSLAFVAETAWLACPGAPGWTIGGSVASALRQAVTVLTHSNNAVDKISLQITYLIRIHTKISGTALSPKP
jgi:hypothetical protein